MKLVMCCVYDKAISAYMKPMYFQSAGQATRAFMDEVNRADSPMHAHPEDYALFKMGAWDDGSGVVENCEPFCLARGHEVKEA